MARISAAIASLATGELGPHRFRELDELLARVQRGLVEHTLEERAQDAADLRPRWDRELAHDIVAVDREIALGERVRGGDLLLDALPQRLERVHARRARTAADVVGAPQREERGDVVETDGPDEATHGRVGPVGLIPEHVMADEVRDLGDRLLVELPAPQDLTRLELADELVLMEVPVGEGVRLPDVVEEAGQSEDEIARRRRVDGRQRVFEDVLRRDLVLRRLLAFLELGADHLEQPDIREHPKGDRGPRRAEDLRDLLVEALAGERRREMRVPADRDDRAFIDPHVEERREAHGAQHPERVLVEALVRFADRTQQSRVEVALPPERVHEIARRAVLARPPGHRVHREVAAREIVAQRVGEGDVIGTEMVGVPGLGSVRRDLDLVLARPHHHGAEAVRVQRARKELLDLVRRRVGRDIPVLRIDTADRIAHASTDHVRVVAGRGQLFDDALDVLRDLELRDRHPVESMEARESLSCPPSRPSSWPSPNGCWICWRSVSSLWSSVDRGAWVTSSRAGATSTCSSSYPASSRLSS